MWLSYHYTLPVGTPMVTQRIKLDALIPYQCGVRPRLAHITNCIFDKGFLAAHLRPRVHWEGFVGKVLEEDLDLFELLVAGEGMCEERSMRLVIGASFVTVGVHLLMSFQITPFFMTAATTDDEPGALHFFRL